MFSTLLIANRGEIACRIIKTARHLGVKTVAVYSEPDARSLHVQMADEAYSVGPAAARESYLNIDALIEAAVRAGADAVHPGYGFLSEDAEFAQAVADAGMIFIGPSPTAIAAMGSKSAAKQLMMEAGVPLVPGYHGADQALETLRAEALKVGYPIMLKASAGGGGRGMRIVTTPGELDDNVASAKREAMAAFSSDELLIERYVTEPRHVEVQVFGDHGGNIVHLFERDCSVQRRHQKIVEEAPGPGISSSLRERICAAAVSAAKAIDYVGAGTVEFLLDRNEQFYFMEMNTRLQVEHPVTELITGYDLVEWQLRVAAGDPLPARQDDIAIRGHAVEVRLYAENPNKNFMPSTGELKHLYFPDHYPLVRVDTGFRGGDNVSVHYDPMLAKVIAWGSDRDEACARLADALHETQVVGVTTNAEYLAALLGHEAFLSGEVNTGFIATHGPELTEQPNGFSPQATALVGAKIGFDYVMSAHERSLDTSDPCSPWGIADGWRLNSRAAIRETLRSGERDIGIEIMVQEPGACDTGRSGGVVCASREMHFDIRIDGERTVSVQGDLTPRPNELMAVVIDGVRQKVALVADGDTYHVFIDRHRHLLDHPDTEHEAETLDAGQGSLAAPMPGKIISVLVEQGQSVNRGTPLMVLEAMKMEHTINAPIDGKVTEVHFKQGDLVEENAELAVVTPH